MGKEKFSGCSFVPNSSIRCTVNQCVHHCQEVEYCGLDSVQIGTHDPNPTAMQNVDCISFRCK